jgi:undecaprenyl pyrophosphate phosphatase UppP
MMQLLSKLYKTYCLGFIFDNKIITDLKHVTDHMLVLIVTGAILWLIHTYVPMDTTIKERIQFTGHNCDNHMGS